MCDYYNFLNDQDDNTVVIVYFYFPYKECLNKTYIVTVIIII